MAYHFVVDCPKNRELGSREHCHSDRGVVVAFKTPGHDSGDGLLLGTGSWIVEHCHSDRGVVVVFKTPGHDSGDGLLPGTGSWTVEHCRSELVEPLLYVGLLIMTVAP